MYSLGGDESTVIVHLQNNGGDYFFPYTASNQPSWNKVFPANFRLWTPDIKGTLFKRIDYMYVLWGTPLYGLYRHYSPKGYHHHTSYILFIFGFLAISIVDRVSLLAYRLFGHFAHTL